jgi:hypothetical protein
VFLFPSFPPACYMYVPSHPWCNNTSSVSGNEWIIKLLNIHSFLVLYYVILLRSNYFPKYFILKQFQFICLGYMFPSMQTKIWNYKLWHWHRVVQLQWLCHRHNYTSLMQLRAQISLNFLYQLDCVLILICILFLW